MELFKLFGSVLVDNKEANKSLQKTDSLASKVAKGVGNGIKTVAKVGAGVATAVGAGGAALFGVAKNAADTGDRIDKLSQKVHMSRQGFQEWEYILSQNGTSIEVLQGGMKKMNKTLDDAKSGNEKAQESFKRVGLSMKELKNATPEEAFEMTVEALQKMPDGAEKAALASELLGRSGSELMPLLNGSSDSVKELKKQAHDLGIVLSDDAVNSSALFTDTLDNLQRSFGAVVSKVGVAVMPIMQQFADWILANMPTIQAVFGAVFGFIQRVVQTAVNIFRDYLLPVIQGVVAWIKTNWPQIKEVISITLNAAKNSIEMFVNIVKGIWNIFKTYILDYVKLAFNTIKRVIQSVLNTIKGIIKTATSIIRGDWKGAWDGIKQIFKGVWDSIKSILKGAIGAVKIIISTAWKAIKIVTSNIWNGIKSVISNVWNGIKSSISNAISSIKNGVSNAWNNIKNTTSRVWEGIKKAVTSPIEKAWNTVKNIIEKIKGAFKFKINFPKIKLPRISVEKKKGVLGIPYPKFNIKWNKEGAILKKAQIFGSVGNQLQGGGEAGPEAVAPISKLQEMIDWNRGENPGLLKEIIELLKLILGKEFVTYLDGRKVSKELAPIINKEFGVLKGRGAY